MKKLTNSLIAFGFVSTMLVTTAVSQPFPGQRWTFDENGSGIFDGPVVGYSNGYLSVEPISHLTGLTYNLGFNGAPGDLYLIEPVAPGTNVSDIIRFDGQGHVFFFSLLEPGEVASDLADVPVLPPPVPGNVYSVNLIETGPEGNNGVLWVPNPGEPGSDPIVPGIQYHFISDIPEPTTTALGLCGAALWSFMRIRRERHCRS